MKRQKYITFCFTYGCRRLDFHNDKPGLIPRPMCFFSLSVSIIAPPQATIIKRNHSKKLWHFTSLHWAGCQRDVSARCVGQKRSGPSVKAFLGSRRGGTGPAIRTLWAKIELQEHKDLQQEQMFSATLVGFMALIKIHTVLHGLCKKHCGRHILTSSRWQMQNQSLSEKPDLNKWRPFRFLSC